MFFKFKMEDKTRKKHLNLIASGTIPHYLIFCICVYVKDPYA